MPERHRGHRSVRHLRFRADRSDPLPAHPRDPVPQRPAGASFQMGRDGGCAVRAPPCPKRRHPRVPADRRSGRHLSDPERRPGSTAGQSFHRRRHPSALRNHGRTDIRYPVRPPGRSFRQLSLPGQRLQHRPDPGRTPGPDPRHRKRRRRRGQGGVSQSNDPGAQPGAGPDGRLRGTGRLRTFSGCLSSDA